MGHKKTAPAGWPGPHWEFVGKTTVYQPFQVVPHVLPQAQPGAVTA
jgi:hypothetical protein